jgi:hypothetical protein
MHIISRAAVVAAVLMSISVPALSKGGDLSPTDLSALKGYTLSMDKINAMQAAMDEAKKNTALSQGMKSVGDDSKSIAEMEARLNAMPQAMAIYRKHGLSAHDVVVMPFALMDAGMCVSYPSAAPKLADRVSPAQIAFYKQHQGEMKKISWLFGR